MKTLSIYGPPAVHADADLSLAQHTGEGLRRAALIRVEDLGPPEPAQRFLQRRDTEAGHGVRQHEHSSK